MTQEIDYEIVCSLALDLAKMSHTILQFFPKNKESILKNLAASNIHLVLFMRDILNDRDGEEIVYSEDEKQFFNECGCKELAE